eukprot:COSAG02_NODE_1168_length_14134_cov_19.590310_14_plen_155_part_00
MMDLLYTSFVHEEENKFLLNLMQVVRICWRDPLAPTENLKEFFQRFQMHLREARAHYGAEDASLRVFPEFTARMLFIAALPAEVQSLWTKYWHTGLERGRPSIWYSGKTAPISKALSNLRQASLTHNGPLQNINASVGRWTSMCRQFTSLTCDD